MKTFVPLQDAGPGCGAKAITLGRLIRAGVAVPKGIVLPLDAGSGWEFELPRAVEKLGGTRFAVRSSGAVEDGSEASFAGQFHTSLDVPKSAVEAEICRTAAAIRGARDYASALNLSVPGRVAVIVQKMLIPEFSGVAFTRDPVTGRRAVVIEAVRGSSEPLVSGQQIPERWRIRPEGEPECSRQHRVLTTDHAAKVARLAVRVETLLGGGQDIEWALSGGQVQVLQARPITAAPTTGTTRTRKARNGEKPLLHGTPASPGNAWGRVRVIKSLDDFPRFAQGEVLVCRATTPAWTPLLLRAAAVVTTGGGILSHAAIVARELRVPAVTDVSSALDLPEGKLIYVDGTNGTISWLASR